MNRNYFESQWGNVKNSIQKQWNQLTDEDIRAINGRFDNLIDKLELRYGWTEEQAENQVRNFSPEIFEKSEEKSHSHLKWALACALPLLLLGLFYLGSHKDYSMVPQPSTVMEEVTVVTQTPNDEPLGQSLRQVVVSSPLFQDLKGLRFSAADGVVTVSGSVATDKQKEAIGNLIRRIPGVNQVNNNIDVRP